MSKSYALLLLVVAISLIPVGGIAMAHCNLKASISFHTDLNHLEVECMLPTTEKAVEPMLDSAPNSHTSAFFNPGGSSS